MFHLVTLARRATRGSQCSRSYYLLLLLVLPELACAQTAPAWQVATSGDNAQAATGTSVTQAAAVDARGNVFVTGSFSGTVGFGSIRLLSAGDKDVFVAKWDATAQAFTWATSGGGTGSDEGSGIAVSGANVYVTGVFQSGSSASLAGQALAGAGNADVFVAKYVDTSTGHTAVTSSFANAWAISGGSTGADHGYALAVSGTSVYVTGFFASASTAILAGQALAGAGGADVFVAKYVDTSTGSTPATSSVANGWATSGGGPQSDVGYGLAVRGPGVFVTGSFTSGTSVSIAGQTLAGAGGQEMFVAKYLDTSTGTTPATSSFANGWAASGGGTANDEGYAVTVSNTGVYVTGYFTSSSSASLAGQALAGAGAFDIFVAKYVDTSTGSTPATSSYANAWAVSGGGTTIDAGTGIAVSGTGVFVAGYFSSGTSAVIAGQPLAGTGTSLYSYDVFVAKYVDTSTGTTPATSSYVNGWATSGGGASSDVGTSLAVSGQQIYTVGLTTPPSTFGSITLSNSASGQINFLGRLTDATLAPLAGHPAAPGTPGLTLYPNPTAGPATLTGTEADAAVRVLDALGRVVATTTAGTDGTAALPGGLVPGVYVVRVGAAAVRLAVE